MTLYPCSQRSDRQRSTPIKKKADMPISKRDGLLADSNVGRGKGKGEIDG